MSGGINPPNITPDSAANWGPLSDWASAGKNDWVGSWIAQVTSVATQFLNFENAIQQVAEVADIDLGGLLLSAFDGIKGVIFTMFPWFQKLEEFLGGIDLLGDDWNVEEAVGNFIETMLNPLGLIESGIDFLGSLFGAGQLPLIPVSALANVSPNLLVGGGFDTDKAIKDHPDWEWGSNEGQGSGPFGYAFTIPNGQRKALVSNDIDVVAGHKLTIGAWFKWAGLVYTPGCHPIRIEVATYKGDTLIATTTIAEFAAPAANSGASWQNISASYTVPATGAPDNIVVQIIVDAGVTAGSNVKVDTASAVKTGLMPQDLVQGLTGALQSLVDKFQEILDGTWDAIFGGDEGPVARTIEDFKNALQNIPAINILGIGGNTNIVETFQDTWDKFWGGLSRATGVGKSPSDTANAATGVADQASTAEQIGVWNNAVLGIRNNKSIMEGIDETEESTFLISDLMSGASEPPSFLVNNTASTIAYWRAHETATKGFISWFGKGVPGAVMKIAVYKLNYETNTSVRVYESGDLSGMTSASWQYLVHYIPEGSRILVNAGDVLAIELSVNNATGHTVAGKIAPWMPTHPTVVPGKPAGTRNGGTTTPSSVAFTSLVYSGNLPWFGLGIVTGDTPPPYQAPRTIELSTPGASVPYAIPAWANILEVSMVGAGAGGGGGNGGNGFAGKGGNPGVWQSETLVRGVDFPIGATQLLFDIGAAGTAGPKETAGGAGGQTRRQAIASGKAALAAAGGTGVGGQGAGANAGQGPGNRTYGAAGTTYIGGAGGAGPSAGSAGSPASAPGASGGGGAGGFYTVAWPGGAGSRGGAWIVARQS